MANVKVTSSNLGQKVETLMPGDIITYKGDQWLVVTLENSGLKLASEEILTAVVNLETGCITLLSLYQTVDRPGTETMFVLSNKMEY